MERTLEDFLKQAKQAKVEVPKKEMIIYMIDDIEMYIRSFKVILEDRPNIIFKTKKPPPAPNVSEIVADIVLLDEDIGCKSIRGHNLAEKLKELKSPPIIISITDEKISAADYHFSGKMHIWNEEAMEEFVNLINKIICNYSGGKNLFN